MEIDEDDAEIAKAIAALGKPDKRLVRALCELAYTAAETDGGRWPIEGVDTECAQYMIGLVRLAERYAASGVPDDLRM